VHGLSIRQRGKHLKSDFFELSSKVWNAYHSPDKRSFSQRLRRLKEWSQQHITGHVLNKVEALCKKRERWSLAFDHPNGHRTSNMLDRVMRSMNRYFDQGLHLHGSLEAANRHSRAWALLYNFTLTLIIDPNYPIIRSPITRAKVLIELLEPSSIQVDLARDLPEMESLITELLEAKRLKG